MELGAGGAAGPRQSDGAEPVRLFFLLLGGGGGGGGSGWAWSPGGGGEGGAGPGTGTESGPEPDYEALPRGSAASTHMLAGAVAGVMEHSLMYPVDCVKVSAGGGEGATGADRGRASAGCRARAGGGSAQARPRGQVAVGEPRSLRVPGWAPLALSEGAISRGQRTRGLSGGGGTRGGNGLCRWGEAAGRLFLAA